MGPCWRILGGIGRIGGRNRPKHRRRRSISCGQGTPLPWTLAGSVPIRAIYERGVGILPATAGPAGSSTSRGASRGMVRRPGPHPPSNLQDWDRSPTDDPFDVLRLLDLQRPRRRRLDPEARSEARSPCPSFEKGVRGDSRGEAADAGETPAVPVLLSLLAGRQRPQPPSRLQTASSMVRALMPGPRRVSRRRAQSG